MIEFSEHAAFTGWNDTALYSEFYRGLAERIKNMLLHMERAITLNQLKIDALKCNNRFWEREHKKILVPVSCAKAIPSTTTQPVKPASNPLGNNPNPDHKDLGNILGTDGKLTEAEKERRRTKNLCLYCGERPDSHTKDCRAKNKAPPTTSGRATFTISGKPPTEASIEDVTEGISPPSGN